MSERRETDEAFAFTVVEDDGERVTIEVSAEDYQREKAAGVEEEALPKPGRYRLRRGGPLGRHPELKIGERKRA
jgi:hypothetical protein